MSENLREIINGGMLPRYNGRKVSIIGLVTKVNPNHLTFDIRAVDDVCIKIILPKPYKDPIEGHVEVHGTAQGGSTIVCDKFLQFPLEDSTDFDIASHNTLINLLQTIPDLWRATA